MFNQQSVFRNAENEAIFRKAGDRRKQEERKSFYMSAATLVLMAAGLGSRFRGGIKQLAKVSPDGALLMDYSIYDALQAGFSRVVFVIRREIEADFKQTIGNRMEKALLARQVEVHYAFQELDDLPAGFRVPEGRTKPFGTGQAVLAAREYIKTPFVVLNADDYYGKEVFRKMQEYLTIPKGQGKLHMAMAGFVLKNTVSPNGTVTRAICRTDRNGMLTDLEETKGIYLENGRVYREKYGAEGRATPESLVSMNMWAAYPEFVAELERGFADFLAEQDGDPLTKEFLLPVFVEKLLKEEKVQVQVLPTAEQWIGITYQEDLLPAREKFLRMTEKGLYPARLWGEG